MTQDETFAAHIRSDVTDDKELRESLLTFGWHPEFPALADENGAVLVGNRRLRIAKEIGIDPIIKTISFGNGDAADATRIKLALVSNLGSRPLSKDDRRRIAEHLYDDKGWTMQRIGEALGVTKKTISKDLEGVVTGSNNPPRPQGGRPKKAKDVAERQEKIVAFADAGVARDEIAHDVGVGRRMVDRVMEVETARRQGRPPIIEPMLSSTAQEKLAAAIRAHKKKLDMEFEYRVIQECRKRMEELSLPTHAKELQDAQDLMRSRRYGVMPRKIFQLIRSCLHTDSRNSVSDKRLNEAFHEFSSRERLLLSEEDAPTITMKFPRTWAEAEEWKRKVKEQRKARARASQPSP